MAFSFKISTEYKRGSRPQTQNPSGARGNGEYEGRSNLDNATARHSGHHCDSFLKQSEEACYVSARDMSVYHSKQFPC